MYSPSFFFNQYDILDSPPPKVIKSKEELQKERDDTKKRNALYRKLKGEDPCLNIID
ncbi:MAG: hypothetical protein AAB681_00835 [Patescibacteria group bacterium]